MIFRSGWGRSSWKRSSLLSASQICGPWHAIGRRSIFCECCTIHNHTMGTVLWPEPHLCSHFCQVWCKQVWTSSNTSLSPMMQHTPPLEHKHPPFPFHVMGTHANDATLSIASSPSVHLHCAPQQLPCQCVSVDGHQNAGACLPQTNIICSVDAIVYFCQIAH